MPFREWDFTFQELVSELLELLREYPGTLGELREWPFHSDGVFPGKKWGGPQASELGKFVERQRGNGQRGNGPKSSERFLE